MFCCSSTNEKAVSTQICSKARERQYMQLCEVQVRARLGPVC